MTDSAPQKQSTPTPRFHGIIPARYASTRFPGKALADINGKPMFWHVYSRASACSCLSSLHLATDDARIAQAARALDVPVVMTSADHASGTNRVHEAARRLGLTDNDVVFNIQGDEAALEPRVIEELAAAFADPDVRAATAATIMDAADLPNPNRVKVVCDLRGNALYFSRSAIPYAREGAPEYLLHIGLYAFTMPVLTRFTAWPQGALERVELLEQLRFLENGIPIRVVRTRYTGMGVDTPEDLECLKAHLARHV